MNSNELEKGKNNLPLGSKNWEVEQFKKENGETHKKIKSSTYNTDSFLVTSFFKEISIYTKPNK